MPASASRSRLVGLALGALLLAVVVGLAVVLPRLEGAEGSSAVPATASSTARVGLPDTVEGYTTIEQAQPDAAADVRDRLDSAAAQLEDTYGVPVTVGLYTTDQPAAGAQGAPAPPQVSLVVTALAVPVGLFLPTGPVPDASLLSLERNANELTRVGDTLCNVSYGQPIPSGQAVDDTALPAGVQCQLNADGFTFQVDGTGLDVKDTATALEEIASGSS